MLRQGCRLIRKLAVLFVVALAALIFPSAADERIGAFKIFDDWPGLILMDGEVGINTPLEFRRATKARPNAKLLILASPGGYVASALIMAGDLHANGYSTLIPQGAGCYSACAFIFLAGKERLAEGELGVHQMFGGADASGIQTTVSDVVEALELFDTPTEVVTRMFRTPSEDMYIFSQAEIERLSLNRLGVVVLSTPGVAEIDLQGTGTPSGTAADRTKTADIPPPPVPGLGDRLALYGGLDFYGEDLSASRTKDAVQCASACMGSSQCSAFTFNANPKLTKGPNCFLKGGVGRLEAYADAFSGVFLSENDDVETFAIGVIDPSTDVIDKKGLTGEDFASSPERGVTTQMQCRMACIDANACKAFTFDVKLRQCYLKYDVGESFNSSKLVSGIKRQARFAPLDVISLED